jgi:hypothetical protein
MTIITHEQAADLARPGKAARALWTIAGALLAARVSQLSDRDLRRCGLDRSDLLASAREMGRSDIE